MQYLLPNYLQVSSIKAKSPNDPLDYVRQPKHIRSSLRKFQARIVSELPKLLVLQFNPFLLIKSSTLIKKEKYT